MGAAGVTGSAGEFLLGVAGESHFGGFAFGKRVPLQLGQRLRVEPRVLSSCADPHLEQTYVPWPGFVPARATTHLPARWRRWLRKGEDSGPVVRPGLGCAGRAAGSANVTSTSKVLGSHLNLLFQPAHQARTDRMQDEPTRGVGPHLGLEFPGEFWIRTCAPSECATRDDGSGEPRHLSSQALARALLNRSARGRAHDLVQPPRPHVVDQP
jgi:hypothetical protein